MSTGSLLQRLTGHFERAGIQYMVVGSFASTLHGTPRTTHDIDIVVALTSTSLASFLATLPEEEFYVSEEAARDALRRRTQFNTLIPPLFASEPDPTCFRTKASRTVR